MTVNLLAIHGNGGGGDRFRWMQPHLPEDVVLHAPSLPGFGGVPRDPSLTDVAGYAGVVADHLRGLDGPRILLGSGIGGSFALEVLRHDADLVDGLILHAPVGPRLDSRLFPRLLSTTPVAETVRRVIAGRALRPLIGGRFFADDTPRDRVDAVLDGYADCTVFAQQFQIITADWWDSLPVSAVPAVVLWGGDERVLAADMAEDLREKLPQADIQTVPGWDHFPMIDQPEAFADQVVGLCRQLAPDAVSRGAASTDRAVHARAHRIPDVRGAAPGTPKAAMLDRAARIGLPVPRGLVIGPEDPVAASASAAAGTPHLDTTMLQPPLVVRSSFDAEDTGGGSAAGRFTSLLHRDHDDLAQAITDVRDSADATVSRADVLVMEQVDAQVAGVAVLEDQHLDDLVQLTAGLADGLVGGREEGHRLLLPRTDLGLASLPVPADVVPDDGWARRLAGLLAGVRAELGTSPAAGWDVEWADDGVTCWLVQVRPLVAPAVRDEVLTLANHAEILPDLPSDLMTSIIVEAGPDLLAWYTDLDPRLPAGRDLVVERAGRPLLNRSLLADILRTWGLPTRLLDDSMGGAGVTHPLTVARLARSSPALLKIAGRQLTAVGDARRRGRELQQLAAAGPATAAGAADAAVAVYAGLVTGMFALANAHAAQVAVLGRLGVLDEVQRRTPTPAGRLQRDLADGVPLDQLLRDHGHRGVYESDLARPRYAEQPDLLEQARAAASTRPRRPAPSPTPAGTAAMPLWLTARRSLAAREGLRDDGMRAFAVVRRRLLDVAATTLEDPDDLWLLHVDEVRRLDDGWTPDTGLLDERRARRRLRAEIVVPDPVGRTQPLTPTVAPPPGPLEPGSDAGPLAGRTLVGGQATGRAWVCSEPPAGAPPFDGPAILVARAVDGGWVHAFGQVEGVVLHLGGDLSHAALILREMGVPTVAGIPDVQRLIPDGAPLRIDAGDGIVTLT